MTNAELNEEIKRFVAEYGYERSEDILLIAIVARQFYDLGCRRTAEKYDEIEYNRQRAEENEKPSAKDAMKELNEKIALVKQRGTWDGVDVDSYMDEVRGRVSDNLEEAADNHIRMVADAAGHPGWDWTTQDIADAFIAGAKWQKEQMMKEDYPKWRRIKAGERLPCPAYVWPIAYDNYPDCFEGRLMPNIQGVKVGRDTWYLPVDVIHNLPKED